ncbi:MAG: glycosyltransferase [Phycisphaerae bacterium]
MRILVQGHNLSRYLAKCHEAFRTGLRAMFDTRCFGRGYPGYLPWGPLRRSYPEIVRHAWGDQKPDLLIASFDYRRDHRSFPHPGIADVGCPTAFVLGDYWDVSDHYLDEFVEIVEQARITYILTYFPQPQQIWGHTTIADRFLYLPPCIDPRLFNDWQEPKVYDVGFLAAGTTEPTHFYPERRVMHEKLLSARGLRYLSAKHPGFGYHRHGTALVGRNFSRAINSCRMFVTTGGRWGNLHAKVYEALASRTMLLMPTPIGAARSGLIAGTHYVPVTEDDLLDQVAYYLAHEDERQTIADAGHRLVQSRHNCYARARQMAELIEDRLRPPTEESAPPPPVMVEGEVCCPTH